MAALVDLLRSIVGARKSEGPVSGVFRLASGGNSYSATGWGFSRVADSVYGNPTGYRAVEAICNHFSRPDWAVFKPGTQDKIETHPLLDVLNKPMLRADGRVALSGTMMQRSMARDLELAGKTIWLKTRGSDGLGTAGPVTGLRRLTIQRCTVVGNQDDELLGFVYNDRAGRRVPFLPQDVIYLRYPHPDRDHDGLAPAIVAGLAAETDNLSQRFNFDLLSNDGGIPGYIMVEGLTPGAFAEAKARWEAGENPGKVRFVSGGKTSYVKVGQSNKDLTYLDLRESSQRDVMKAFGTPPAVVLDVTNETYANASAEFTIFVRETVLGKWVLVRDELTAQLDGDTPGPPVTIGFDLDPIEELHEGLDSIVDRIDKLTSTQFRPTPIIEVNEAREMLDLNTVPWGNYKEPEPPPAPVIVAPSKPAPKDGQQDEEQGASLDDLERLTASLETQLAGIQAPTPKSQASTPWHVFDRRVTKYEERAQRKMRAFFRRQGQVVAARIEHSKGKAHVAAFKLSSIFDRGRWDGELAEDMEVLYDDTIDAFGTAMVDDLGRGTWDAASDVIKAWITQRSTAMAGLVNDTTEEELRSKLADLEGQGLGIAEIAAQIRDYFDPLPQKDGEDDADYAARIAGSTQWRAENFARTEIVKAANFGYLQGGKQAGGTTKTWLGTADDRMCDDCAAADGETVPIDEPFSNGEDTPDMHPSDRCTLTIGFGDEGSNDEEGE